MTKGQEGCILRVLVKVTNKQGKGNDKMIMLMDRKFIIRRRFAFAIAVVVAVAVLALASIGLDHFNWVGDGYCFKSSMECYFPEGGK